MHELEQHLCHLACMPVSTGDPQDKDARGGEGRRPQTVGPKGLWAGALWEHPGSAGAARPAVHASVVCDWGPVPGTDH